jgi:hypothetical protein
MTPGRKLLTGAAAALAVAVMLFPLGATAAAAKPQPGLTAAQRADLRGIARGHAGIAITLDRYAKLFERHEQETLEKLDAFLERADTAARLAQVAREAEA